VSASSSLAARVAQLEEEVARLREQVEVLQTTREIE
jgi:uncharacterized protein YceH (UPF0502 family)